MSNDSIFLTALDGSQPPVPLLNVLAYTKYAEVPVSVRVSDQVVDVAFGVARVASALVSWVCQVTPSACQPALGVAVLDLDLDAA